MKTLSRTFVFVVLVVIAIGAVVTFNAFAAGSAKHAVVPKKFHLKIGKTPTDYADVTSKDDFIKKLRQFGEDQYDFDFVDHAGGAVEHYPPLPKMGIKTDKVTTSEVAQNAPAGESAANDPNVTHLLTSDSATDIKSFLDTFK
jgi:hypothetical protein